MRVSLVSTGMLRVNINLYLPLVELGFQLISACVFVSLKDLTNLDVLDLSRNSKFGNVTLCHSEGMVIILKG